MKYYFILFLMLCSTIANAKEIKGVVYGKDPDSEKSALANASVQWLESKKGVYADQKGNFSIEKSSADKHLIVSYTGYTSDTIEVGDKAFVEALLSSDYTTDEITVTESKPGQTIALSDIHKTEVITSRGLLKAACCNLSESFETNPSVDVSYSDAVTGAKQIELLGLGGAYTQLMIEKVPNLRGIASAYGLSYIPGSWMESISISKGSATVSSGYESITGQITVDLKKPTNNVPLFFNLYGNQHSTFEANLNSSYEITDDLSTMLLAGGSFLNTEIDVNADRFLDEPLKKQLNLMNRWIYNGEIFESQFGAKMLYEDRKAGQLGYHSGNNSLYGIDINTNRYEANWKLGAVLPGAEYHSIAMITSAIYHDQNSFFGPRSYDAKQMSLYGTMIYEHSFGHDHKLHDANNAEAMHKEEYVMKDDHKVSAGLSIVYDNYNELLSGSQYAKYELVPGAFLEYTFKGIENLTLIGGLRADHHNKYGLFFTPRIHAQWHPVEEFTIRASAGRGFRTANVIAEHPSILASSREIVIADDLKPEIAWNYGLNFGWKFEFLDRDFALNGEFYRTDFNSKVILDLDKNPQQALFYNLNGESYSNSLQFDFAFDIIDDLNVWMAYRFNDVQETINGELTLKPLSSPHKAFLNLAYAIDVDDWTFDYTLVYHGKGRLPNTDANPIQYRLGNEFPAFFTMNAQITKKLWGADFYLGAENLTDYRQPNPILSVDNPGSPYFDGSMIWAPVLGRKIYAGVRVEIE